MKEGLISKKALWLRIVRILLRVFLVVIALVIILLLSLNIPAFQTYIAAKFLKSLGEKTGTGISIGSVKIALPNTVIVNDLFLADQNADTLLYLHSLNVDVSLFRMMHNEVAVKHLTLENVLANMNRQHPDSAFNFQFLVDAFSPKTTIKPDTTHKPKPWLIDVDEISLHNIRFNMSDARSGTDLRVNLGNFNASINETDILNKKINTNEILLQNTSVALAITPGKDNPDVHTVASVIAAIQPDNTETVFIALNLLASQLTIENTSFRLDNNSAIKLTEGIDYQHMDFRNLNAIIHNVNIDSLGYRADFESLSVAESCGLNLKMLSANAKFTDKTAELKNLKLETAASKISGELNLEYESFNGFLADLWKSKATLDIEESTVNANEIFLFVPFLTFDPLLGKLKNSEILVSAKASGELDDLDIENLELALLDNTIMKSACRLTGLPDMNSLFFEVAINRFTTTYKDISRFVDPSLFAGLTMPPSIELQGKVKGKVSSLNGDFDIRSSLGALKADAFYKAKGLSASDTFNIDFTAHNILAGTILSDTLFGKASFTGKASGSGISSNHVAGSAHLEFQEAQFNAYTYRNLIVDGQIGDDMISAKASSIDTNINFRLSADADLRETKQKYSAKLFIQKANLRPLNFTGKELSVSTNLKAEANYSNMRDADAHLLFSNTILTNSDKNLPVGLIEIKAASATDSLNLKIHSDMVDGTASSNIPPQNLGKTLLSAFNKYFGIIDTTQIKDDQHLDFGMDIHVPEDFMNLISPESEELNISNLRGSYNTGKNRLSVEMKLPHGKYAGIVVDTLDMALKGESENVNMVLNVMKVSYDTLTINNLFIKEMVSKGTINSEISVLDSAGNPSYFFASKIETGPDFYSLSLLPNGLILDNQAWKVQEGNHLEKRNNNLEAGQFVFTNGKQSLGFETDLDNKKIIFENFAIQNLFNILTLKSEHRLLKGNLDGEVVFPVSGEQKFINANITVNDLYFQDSLVGNLFFDVKTQNDRMEIETRFENDQNKIRMIGDIDHLSGVPMLNLNAKVDIPNLSRLERISLGYLSEMSGKIGGEITIKGTTAKPEILGDIGFSETAFRVNSLNFLAKIKDEKINFNPAGIRFNDFEIEDNDAKKLTINGDILTNDFSNFGFDLELMTREFQPMNSTVTDNQMFYGKLSLDADVKLKGDTKSPKLTADVKINNSTDLTYALPGSELQLVTSEGVVEFINPTQLSDSLIKLQGDYITDSVISRLAGLDFALNLEIDPEAKFTVDIDPKSGDFLNVSGGAKLNITADADGKQAITGIYEVKNGVYQLSFYGLVKKTFTIAPGSTVSWSGKPMEADLDITAEYEVRTSSVSLVANETAGMSDAEKQTFNKRLPYMVKLNINGFLSEPEISFKIDLPEKYMLTYPPVATKLAQLNSEENKQELNKQVFALLVTGSFMADNPLTSNNSTPTNIASTAARNSVNGILADQLNNVSGRYITAVDLNFGLTSYEDFENASGDIRTEMDIQVSKKLFNDRITVEAMGSIDLEGNKTTTTTSSKKMTNEFAVIYQLTESGEYKLRAYYEDAYDLFDGDISYSGIAIIFEKEIDTLKKKRK